MFTVIFGRPGCPFCVRAKDVADQLKSDRDDFDYRYVDIQAEGITKLTWKKPSVNRCTPCRRFLSMRIMSAALPNLKPTLKNTWAVRGLVKNTSSRIKRELLPLHFLPAFQIPDTLFPVSAQKTKRAVPVASSIFH